MDKKMNLNSVGNARELGGYTTEDGKIIRRGLLLRTAYIGDISEQDIKTLQSFYHISAIADFRMGMEAKGSPDPEIPGVNYYFLPVMELEDYPGFKPEMMDLLTDPNTDRFQLMKLGMEMGTFSDHLYVDFLMSDRGKRAYRAFFKLLLDVPAGHAVLWHCTDGKDRTGLAAMLLLTALGCSKETIMEDYLMTNSYNEKKLDMVKSSMEEKPVPKDFEELALFGAGAVYDYYMQNAMDALEENYGSIMGYISTELGVGEKELADLRSKYLD